MAVLGFQQQAFLVQAPVYEALAAGIPREPWPTWLLEDHVPGGKY
jgi:hypothetical protein